MGGYTIDLVKLSGRRTNRAQEALGRTVPDSRPLAALCRMKANATARRLLIPCAGLSFIG